MVSSILKSVFKSKAPIPVKIIAWYFLLNGIATILEEITYQSLQFGHPFLHDFSFLYESLPGILSNDPFNHGVIVAIPLYDTFSIFLKSLATIVILLIGGYKLLRMEKQGWYFGMFIVVFGLLVTAIINDNPISYTQNVFGGIGTYGLISGWTIMSVAFLINIFALIYLPTHKKLFKKK